MFQYLFIPFLFCIPLLFLFKKELLYIQFFIILTFHSIKNFFFHRKYHINKPVEIFKHGTIPICKVTFKIQDHSYQIFLPYKDMDIKNYTVTGIINNQRIDITQPSYIPYLFTVKELGFDYVELYSTDTKTLVPIHSGKIDLSLLFNKIDEQNEKNYEYYDE